MRTANGRADRATRTGLATMARGLADSTPFSFRATAVAVAILCLWGSACISSPAAAGEPRVVAASTGLRGFGNRSGAPFVTNVGQFDDEVAFCARTSRGPVFVTRDGAIIYVLARSEPVWAGTSLALRERLIGGRDSGSGSCEPTGCSRSGSGVAAFTGHDPSGWIAPAHDEVLIEAGDGIQLLLRTVPEGVEKVFTVEPGADPGAIRIEVDGPRGLGVDGDGMLVLRTAAGEVRFTRPVAYQLSDGKARRVAVEYSVEGNAYGFLVGDYDSAADLVIDPLLASSYLGGSDAEGGYCADAVAFGPDGTVYVTGDTASDDFPTTFGEPYHGGASDVFVSRFDRTLENLLASCYIGGSDEEQASCITVDAGGNVYVSGGTMSGDFPTTEGAYDRTYNGGTAGPYAVPGDIFIVKLSQDFSSLLASTYFGGASFDYCRAVVLNGGTAYITGATASSGLATAGAFDETRNTGGMWSGIDAVVARFDTSLATLLSATYLGGSDADYCEDMVAGPGGGLYVTGWTASGDYPFSAAGFDTTFGGGTYDAFVTGLDASLGSLLGSTYLGGTSWDFGYAITADDDGHVYVTGHNAEAGTATTFPTTPGSYQPEYRGIGGANVGDDAFVSKFDGTLSTLVASTEFGGTGWEYGTGLEWDQSGHVCLVGTTTSEDFPRHQDAFQYDYAGDDGSGHSGEGFVSRLTDDLSTLSASTYLGGSGNDWPECVALDGDGNACVTGSTTSPDFPAMSGSYEEDWQGGESDAFVSVLSRDLGALSFTRDPDCGLPPVGVTFTGVAPADPSPDAWEWDTDGDGDTDTTGQDVQWIYEAPGLYDVRLTVSYGPFRPSTLTEESVLVFDESSALLFTGDSGHASCPADAGINLTDAFTLEAWIEPYDWGGFPFAQMGLGQIVSKGPVSLQVVGVHALYNDHSLSLSIRHTDGTTSVSFTPVESLALDAWQHVAATYDGTTSTVRMWVDGIEQSVAQTVAPSGNVADNLGDDLLVGNIAALNKGFEGAIDEVSVWNLARDPGDVESGVGYPLFGDEPGLEAWWRLDEAGGDSLADGSGGAHTAMLSGATWTQGVLLSPTGVSPWTEETAPGSTLLPPAMPNPFHPTTTVSFSLPNRTDVLLGVYDVRGRLVATLADGVLDAGPHSATWDGTDRRGGLVSSGVYFCRLTTDVGIRTAKLVLAR
ncbi:MAG: SBBP repeat-containing protein [Candidatus Eisenbacteria bacterium]|nr:SBBP repeat-containing protein [Candidatus Eisenbacteria bacterium]